MVMEGKVINFSYFAICHTDTAMLLYGNGTKS